MYTATRKGIISWTWLFRSRKREGSLGNSRDSAPPPPYNNHSHYPGGRKAHKSNTSINVTSTLAAKHSTRSITSLPPHPPPKRSHDSDFDSNLEFVDNRTNSECFGTAMESDATKLVHDPTCVRNLDPSFQSSDGSSTIDCSCQKLSSRWLILLLDFWYQSFVWFSYVLLVILYVYYGNNALFGPSDFWEKRWRFVQWRKEGQGQVTGSDRIGGGGVALRTIL